MSAPSVFRPLRAATLTALACALTGALAVAPATSQASTETSWMAGEGDDLALDPSYEPQFTRAAGGGFPDSDLISVDRGEEEALAKGVTKEAFTLETVDGVSTATLLTVDLRKADVGLLTAPKVASNQRLDDMAGPTGAVAALNGDFFQNTDDHGGVPVTGAAAGAEVLDGVIRQSAVPWKQRFGGTMPQQYNDGNEVIGQLRNGRAVITDVDLRGFINARPIGKVGIDSLNQYGLNTDEIAMYDDQWGAVSRERATCGSEFARQDPCSDEVTEVIVRDGKVESVSHVAGAGQLGEDEFALIGREAGARTLAQLEPGTRVASNVKATSPAGKLDWALGGGVLVRDGELADMGEYVIAPRSAAGISEDGRTLQLLAVDGRVEDSAGIRLREIGDLLRHLGSDDVMLLDGGGSTTMLGRPDADAPWALYSRVRADGIEVLRAVPNGIGVFSR